MDPLVWQQATNDITERVINHPRFLEETDIYCYANYNGEVGTSSIMEEAWKLGKSVWFPQKEVLCTSAIRMQLQLHADSDVFPDICHKSRRHIQSCGILHQKRLQA